MDETEKLYKRRVVPSGLDRDLVNFVMARWQESGGFGSSPAMPASIEDTYHAIRILMTIRSLSEKEVRQLKDNPYLKAFLMRKGDEESWSFKTAYQYLFLCDFCGLVPSQGWLKGFERKKIKEVPPLQERYYLARILREGSIGVSLSRRTEAGASSSEYEGIFDEEKPGSWRTAEELCMCLYLFERPQEALHATNEDMIGWLQACQTPDGGFGAFPGTTSFIENSHWCLKALSLLDAGPQFPDRARDFILGCKTQGGGFARKSGGAPFLYATWHAVASLLLLGNMP